MVNEPHFSHIGFTALHMLQNHLYIRTVYRSSPMTFFGQFFTFVIQIATI